MSSRSSCGKFKFTVQIRIFKYFVQYRSSNSLFTKQKIVNAKSLTFYFTCPLYIGFQVSRSQTRDPTNGPKKRVGFTFVLFSAQADRGMTGVSIKQLCRASHYFVCVPCWHPSLRRVNTRVKQEFTVTHIAWTGSWLRFRHVDGSMDMGCKPDRASRNTIRYRNYKQPGPF